MLKQETRRVCILIFMYLLLYLFLQIFPSCWINLKMSNELTYLVDVDGNGLAGSVLYPLLCVLTTAESYLMEYRSGYRYSSMSRTSKTRYAVFEDGSGNWHRSSHCSAVLSALWDGLTWH